MRCRSGRGRRGLTLEQLDSNRHWRSQLPILVAVLTWSRATVTSMVSVDVELFGTLPVGCD